MTVHYGKLLKNNAINPTKLKMKFNKHNEFVSMIGDNNHFRTKNIEIDGVNNCLNAIASCDNCVFVMNGKRWYRYRF